MRIDWFTFDRHNEKWPTVKVDGQAIRNVVVADDVEGFVEFIKGRKLKTIRGKVEII